MKKIRIGFCDFWDGFLSENSPDRVYSNLLKAIKNVADVEIIDAYDDSEKDKIEYLFFSLFGHEHIKFDCIKIFFTGENFIPDFNLCDYALGFNGDLSFGDRYLRYPLYVFYDEFAALQKMSAKDKTSLSEKTGFCAMVVSNGVCEKDVRNTFFNKLSSEYKQVDSGGKHLNNIGLPPGEGVADKNEFLKKYKFSFAFENTSEPGYCTEKIVQSYFAKTVPIYWGDPEVAKYFNEDSFINCMDYDNFDSLINEIKRIDNDDELYLKMLNAEPINDGYRLEDFNKKLIAFFDKIFNTDYEKAVKRKDLLFPRAYKKELKRLYFPPPPPPDPPLYIRIPRAITRRITGIFKK